MSLILTAIGLDAAVGTNFITVNRLSFHFKIWLSKKVDKLIQYFSLTAFSLLLTQQKVRNQHSRLTPDFI
jgi:hypothetical protein